MPQFTIELSNTVSALLEKKSREAGLTPSEFASKLIVAGLGRELRFQALVDAIDSNKEPLERLLMSRHNGPFFEIVGHFELSERVLAATRRKNEAPGRLKARRWLQHDLEREDLVAYALSFPDAEEAKSELMLFPSMLENLHLHPEASHSFATSNPELQSVRFAPISHRQSSALFFEPSPEGDGIRVLHLMSVRSENQ